MRWRVGQVLVATGLLILLVSMTIDAGIAEVDQAATHPQEATVKAEDYPAPEEAQMPSAAQTSHLPEPSSEVSRVIYATVTTYQAVPEQTDSTPCDGAMPGVDFCAPPFPIVANNCLALGTKVEIRRETYTVADRMNSRYGCSHFDVLTTGQNYMLTNEPVTVQ